MILITAIHQILWSYSISENFIYFIFIDKGYYFNITALVLSLSGDVFCHMVRLMIRLNFI
jgi:hypothetical protein